MVQYETYQSNAAEVPTMRRWVIAGLALSLALHAGLIVFFYQMHLEGFGVVTERSVPSPIFAMRQVSLPDLDNADRVTLTEKLQGTAPITVPDDKPEVKEITIAPQIPDVAKQIPLEKPKVEASPSDKMAMNDAASRAEMDKALTNISSAILKDGPAMPRQPILRAPSGAGAANGKGDANANIPGMASISDMLEKTGSLRAGDKAGMPGGALFEYDSYLLRDEAVGQLKKLARLIQLNPKATFSIEGHSDSFGNPEYNQKLSEARAEEVKKWLVMNFNITPDRITTKGFGNSKPLVSADKSKEEQAPNRRVELVVKTSGGKK